MCHLVNEMFPPPPEDLCEEFSSFSFWRDPIPEIDLKSVEETDEGKLSSKSKKIKSG